MQFNLVGEPISEFSDVVVPFNKINKILSEKQESAQEAEKPAVLEKSEKVDNTLQNQAQCGKTVQQEVRANRKEQEKPITETEPKKERKPPAEKQKPAAEQKTPDKEESPAPEQLAEAEGGSTQGRTGANCAYQSF